MLRPPRPEIVPTEERWNAARPERAPYASMSGVALAASSALASGIRASQGSSCCSATHLSTRSLGSEARPNAPSASHSRSGSRGGMVVLLHDRRMPRGRSNVDHLAVAPSGVYVIDAKDSTGKVRVERPSLGKPKLLVNGRDRTKIVDGLDRQVAAVRDTINDRAIAVHGVFCFTRADIPIVLKETIRGHALLHRKALAKRLNADGPLDAAAIDALARRLATALPAA